MPRRHLFLAVLIVLAVSTFASAQSKEPHPSWRTELIAPPAEFTQVPFWFWNDDLSNDEIGRQMAEFRQHGVYGFIIHARMGLPAGIPYQGERWLGHVRFAVEEAARTGMSVCLYDEAMYPSGSAHGRVVQANPAFAAQGLCAQAEDVVGPKQFRIPAPAEGKFVACIVAKRPQGDGPLDLRSARVIDQPGKTMELAEGTWRVMRFACVPSGGHIRGIHAGEDDGQPNAPPAADLLNPKAMQVFIHLCYDPYYETLKDHFGKTVFAIFTDEPNVLGRGARRGLQPWTDGLAEDFARRRGYAILPLLPALFFEAGPQTAKIRGDFALTVAERLDETYYQQISQWCADHGIALTGHSAGSDEIRPLRLFQLPGQDMVWRWVLPNTPTGLEGANSTVAKCSSSVARHDRRRRNANEIYGAYGWHLTMDEMKWLADWLTVRGVNLLYPHAFYYSIREERINERPPDLGMHNAWWPQYRRFADYTSRLCGLMTDSQQVCDVAVLSVENHLPWRAAKWLYQNQVDFNYLEDWRLLEQAKLSDGTIQVGEMTYRLLIVDEDGPLTGPLADRVKQFSESGGLVRVCGVAPSADLVAGLERDLTVEPSAPDLRYVHVRKHGMDFSLLVNEGEEPIRAYATCRVQGNAEWFDPWTASFRPAEVLRADAGMMVPVELQRRQSLVLCVDPSQKPQLAPEAAASVGEPKLIPVSGPWKVLDAKGKTLGDQLGDWRNLPGLKDFAGTLGYETRFNLSKQPGSRYELDLGAVGDWAMVRLNGKDLGPLFWAPYVIDVTEALVAGPNELVVEVTNSRANRLAPKEARPSGLFGPAVVRARSIP